MRECRVLTDLHVGATAETELLVSGLDQVFKLLLRHSLVQRMVCSFIRRERDLAGQPHQSDFMIALDHATSSSNRSGGGDFHLTSSFGNPFGEDKAHCFFHSDGSSGDAAILKALRNPLIRTFIFLPHADSTLLTFPSVCDLFRPAPFLECGATIKCLSFLRQKNGNKP